jgi:hypothetical protein
MAKCTALLSTKSISITWVKNEPAASTTQPQPSGSTETPAPAEPAPVSTTESTKEDPPTANQEPESKNDDPPAHPPIPAVNLAEPTKSTIRDIINSVSNDDNTNSDSNDSSKSNQEDGEPKYFDQPDEDGEGDENSDVFDSLFGDKAT